MTLRSNVSTETLILNLVKKVDLEFNHCSLVLETILLDLLTIVGVPCRQVVSSMTVP